MLFSFLGLGNMGAPIAQNILDAGGDLQIYTSRPQCAARFKENGARIAHSIRELADCDALCTCLPMPQDVLDAAIGKHGLYDLMKRGSIHLEMSTIAPATAKILHDAAAARGLGYVQATILKTPQVAAKKEEALFVGGDAESVDKLTPMLQKIGKPINVHGIEASCMIKLLSNMIGMSNIVILAEAMRVGKTAGIDPHELVKLLQETGADSFQLDTRGPWIAEEDYKARFSINLAIKDLRLGCEMASNMGCETEMTASALKCLEKASAEGLGDEDVCAVGKTGCL